MASKHGADWKAFEAAVRHRYFESHRTTVHNRKKLANNTKLGMRAYGIIDEASATLTEFGQKLFAIRSDKERLYRELARHILLNLHGMTLVQTILDKTAAGERVDLTTMRGALADRGVNFPSGGKHPSIMRLWLERAGIFVGSRWRVDESRLEEILGVTSADFLVLAGFSVQQRAFLRALLNSGAAEPQRANDVVRLAAMTYGVKFPEKSVPKEVLEGLRVAGYIVARKTTGGRGAKPFLVAPTPKAITEVLEPLLKQLETRTDVRVVQLLRKSMAEIIKELKSARKHVAGLALEALGFKLMRLIDMDYVATRLRGEATGGAEVDLIFESTRLVYSRWQIQCKNTERVGLDDVAKEVGLTHLLKSNAIVLLTTGEIGAEARRYANKIMADTNLAIVMMNGDDLDAIATNASAIVDVFTREARHAMKQKGLELDGRT
ncbi:MAG: restriction endonuclease [Alphaproteobacteria bacterium]|nr:restriction endonuclease [Alphaproteobacteria bacterium]